MISQYLQFCLNLSRAQAALARRFDASLGGLHGLGFGDFAILFHLTQAPEGRLRRVDLANQLGLTVSGVTRTLIPLEKRGIVTRQSDPHDARVAYAVLTPVGRDLLMDSISAAEQVSQNAISRDHVDYLPDLTDVLIRIAES